MNNSIKKALMVIAPKNFCDEEYFKSRVVLQSNGIQVKTCAGQVSEATGMLGGKAKIDIDLADVKVNDFDAFIFVGGEGVKIYFKDKTALKLVKQAAEENKIIGAISQANKILTNAGVSVKQKNLEIVAVDGLEKAEEFGSKIAELIKK